MGDAIDADQLAVGGRVAGDLIVMLAAIGVRGEMLAAVLQPAHRIIDAAARARPSATSSRQSKPL